MQTPLKKKPSQLVLVRRAVILAFMFGVVATTGLVILTAMQFGGGVGPGTYHLELGPLTFFTVVKEVLDGGGSTAQLRPGYGVVVLMVLLPALAGVLAWFKKPTAVKGDPGNA